MTITRPKTASPPIARTITISEYGHADIQTHELDHAALLRLQHLREHGAVKSYDATPTGWRIKAAAVVGVILLGRVRLKIQPKIAINGSTLMTWMRYAHGVKPVTHHPTSRHWHIDPVEGYFADLVINALVDECRALLRTGLRREYQRIERTEPVLRGRIDLYAQATRHYGQADRFHVRTYHRSPENWENIACGTALRAAAQRAYDPALAYDATETAARFPHTDNSTLITTRLQRAAYNRINQHYRSAHAWARLVLGTGGVTDLLLDAGHQAQTLLLRMDRLWERVVIRMTEEAAEQVSGRVIHPHPVTAHGDVHKHRTLRPDSLIEINNHQHPLRIPVDAKYIAYANNSVESSVIHQLLTYIACYTTPASPDAFIVYPTPGPTSLRTLTFPHHARLGRIHVIGVDTNRSPSEGAAELQRRCSSLI